MINFYSAWFCPYAQRAWMALEHYQIPYNTIESLIVKDDQNKGDHGYEKNSRLVELNPKGQVPTLELTTEIIKELGMKIEDVEGDERVNVVDQSFVVKESMICMEFIRKIAQITGSDKPDLIPDETLLSDAKKFDEKICSSFYKILMKPTIDEQNDEYENFANGISEYVDYVQNDGFFKSQSPTVVDYAIIPWILRDVVLRHYRPRLQMEKVIGKVKFDRLKSYIERMKNLDSVRKTLWTDDDTMLQVYRRYADGTAQSQVGQAVRDGKNAHDA